MKKLYTFEDLKKISKIKNNLFLKLVILSAIHLGNLEKVDIDNNKFYKIKE